MYGFDVNRYSFDDPIFTYNCNIQTFITIIFKNSIKEIYDRYNNEVCKEVLFFIKTVE